MTEAAQLSAIFHADNYQPLIAAAQRAAASYDGSLNNSRLFRMAVKKLHDAAGPASAVIIEDLYQQARQNLRGSADRESSYAAVFKVMDDLETDRVIKNKNPLDKMHTATAGTQYAPKFSAIVDALVDRAFFIDYMNVIAGPDDSAEALRDQYIVLDVPRLDLQIAVCDRLDTPVYVSKKTRDYTFWVPLNSAYNDNAISRLDKIEENDPGRLAEKVLNVVGIAAPIGEAFVERLYPKKPEIFVVPTLSVVNPIPAAATTPAVKTKKTKTNSGEPKTDQEAALDCLRNERRFVTLVPSGATGTSFMQKWIMEQVAVFRADNEGRNPTRDSGPLKNYPDIDWALIDDAIYRNGRIHKMLLARFIEVNDAPVKVPRALKAVAEKVFKDKSPTTKTGPDDKKSEIMAMILELADTHKCFPSVTSPNNSPELQIKLEQIDSWLLAKQKVSLSGFIKTWVREKALEYALENNSELPDQYSGPIKGFETWSWDLLETCFQAYPKKPTLNDIFMGDPRLAELQKSTTESSRNIFAQATTALLNGLERSTPLDDDEIDTDTSNTPGRAVHTLDLD